MNRGTDPPRALETRRHLVVPPGLGNDRLDRVLPAVLAHHGHDLSRRQARRWIADGLVAIDGCPVRVASRQVPARARLTLPDESRHAAPPSAAPWEVQDDAILFEDDHLLALDKPAGLASQARRDDGFDHLLAAGRRHLQRRGQPSNLFLVHRLDRGTSGIVLLAKDRATATALGGALATRQIEKYYLALVRTGRSGPDAAPTPWTVHDRLAIERLPGGRRRAVRVVDGGREAETAMRCLAVVDDSPWGRILLIEARPRTGRMHQIRVHLMHSGLSLLGDRLYAPGDSAQATPRPMLHAQALHLVHPTRGEPLILESPLPADFRHALGEPRPGDGQRTTPSSSAAARVRST